MADENVVLDGSSEEQRTRFFQAAMTPGFGDEFAVLMQHERDDDGTLSKEAVEMMAYQTHDFLMASLMRRWRETGQPPKYVRLNLSIDWDDERTSKTLVREEPNPWWAYTDTDGGAALPQTDGEHRKLMAQEFLRDKR